MNKAQVEKLIRQYTEDGFDFVMIELKNGIDICIYINKMIIDFSNAKLRALTSGYLIFIEYDNIKNIYV